MVRPPLVDVPGDAPQQADVRLHAHVQLQKHQLAQALVVEHVDTLDDQNLRRVDQLVGIVPAVIGVIVTLAGNGLARHEGLHVLQKEVMVENFRFIVIELLAFLQRQAGMIAIVAIVVDDRGAWADGAAEFLCQSAFSAAACAADADDQHNFVPLRAFVVPYSRISS